MAGVQQPEWRSPPPLDPAVGQNFPKLSMYNSLTRTKTPFVPRDRSGKKIGWYACGPTVYDDAHLGHARNYVSTDIIRRILQDYFKFDVEFVMNITDVDDKIILAGRQQHLLARWLAKQTLVNDEVRETTKKAYAAYLEKNLALLKPDTAPETFDAEVTKAYGHVLQGQNLDKDGSPPGDREAKVKMHLNTARSAAEALSVPEPALPDFASKATGVLLPYIDSLQKHEIHGQDHEIFTKLTKRYEERFFHDMAALNVRYPDKLTRVTEYGPQIVDFVKQIQGNGFAYEHEGSIYYDTNAWEASGGAYARLEPWNRNDKELQQDGEGSLATKTTGFKRSAADFALWKASKQGEPSWASPWGEGRPGWHIECSAMASDVLGKQFDIHSGGIDLAFPHHDNELAQSEAYWAKSGKDSEQWVNYFLHMGHLSIQGSKMSKSLKNFTTIREALSQGTWTPRGLRIVFLLGAWRDGLEITGDVIKASVAWEEKVNNLFIKIRDSRRMGGAKGGDEAEGINGTTTGPSGTNGEPSSVGKTLESAQERLHDALCDSFDTPTAMRVISDLITAYNSEKHVPDGVAEAVGRWITETVVMLGLDADYHKGEMGWSGVDIPEEAKPFVYPLSELRDRIREQAKAGAVDTSELKPISEPDAPDAPDAPASARPYARAHADFQRTIRDLHAGGAAPKDYLAACDRLRDATLWDLGIYLEDRDAPARPALVRPLSAALRQERRDREALAASKAAAKAQAQARLDKGRVAPADLFRTPEYSAWDADGVPTRDAAGEEVTKSRAKKLRKDWERQKKLHETWSATAAGGGGAA